MPSGWAWVPRGALGRLGQARLGWHGDWHAPVRATLRLRIRREILRVEGGIAFAMASVMHPTAFETKMAHFAFNRIGRTFTERHGLTPARLDMLRVILQEDGCTYQKRLRDLLGVTKSVTSQMIRDLEKLGFVVRRKSTDDRRTFVLRLTERAEKALRSVYFEAITEGFLRLIISCGIGKPDRMMGGGGFERAVINLIRPLRAFRKAYGLPVIRNPWEHPERSEEFYFADVPDNPIRWGIIPTQKERQRFSRDAPADIHDEVYPIDPETSWPIWPAEIRDAKRAEVARKDAAVASVRAIIRGIHWPQ